MIWLNDDKALQYGKGVHICVDNCKANKEAEQKIDNFEVPFSLNKTVIRKIKDITNWLTL